MSQLSRTYELLVDAVGNDELVHVTLAYYRQPHRHYHGEQHLVSMFGTAKEHGFALNEAQKLAVLFHDAVYVPGAPKGQNEALSVALLKALADGRAGGRAPLRAYAGHVGAAGLIIMDTVDHRKATIPDAAAVLDLDLSSLAGHYAGFLARGEEIRSEYRHLVEDDAKFNLGRAEFYGGMLDRKHLFHTAKGRQLFEAEARDNMTRHKSELVQICGAMPRRHAVPK